MFNCIFSSGIVPDSWLLGNIKPIYKNKGDPLNPKHFRPITILSCFGKLFTSILLRDRPFNLKRGGGGMVFCFVQNLFFGQHES